MRDFSTPRTFIFSAELAEHDEKTNQRRTSECGLVLSELGIPFREGLGRFDGAEEACFIVHGASNQDDVFEIASVFGQRFVLVVAEHDRTAYLVPVRALDGNQAGVIWRHEGVFRCAGDTEPEGDYTKVGDLYFNIDETDGPDLEGGI